MPEIYDGGRFPRWYRRFHHWLASRTSCSKRGHRSYSGTLCFVCGEILEPGTYTGSLGPAREQEFDGWGGIEGMG
jgi:ribosomal protein L32